MASGAIKGITIEIGGDTTKLGKAIGDSEKKTRSLQTELKNVEKMLRFDPTNTELLTQKQAILGDTILETSKKLDTLKEAEEQVVAQFEKGDIGEEQLRAFQREIIQTENTLAQLSDELKTATHNLDLYGDNNGVAKAEAAKLEQQIKEQNDALEAEKKKLQEAEQAQKDHEKAVEQAKETMSDFKDSVSDAVDALGKGTLALGGTALAGGGYALKLSTDFDKAFNTLSTRTGASAEEMESLNEAMENVYANNFGDSIEDVAQSMATVKTQTKLSGGELQNATERALLLRDTFEFDVNESTRAATMLMDQYGMSAEDAYNLIAQGAQSGLDKNGDLLDTINEYAVHFNSLGYTSEEMFNMLVNGAEEGTFSVDKLGDAVKEFGIRAKDGTAADALSEYRKSLGLSTKDVKRLSKAMASGGKESKDAMQEVVASVFEIEDPIKRNTVGVELFGTMWEDLGEDGVKALMNVEGKISTTNKALDSINDQKYDDIGSALQGLGRTLETDVIAPLGDELKPVVEDAISYVQEHGPQIKEILSEVVTKIGEFVGFIVDNGDKILAVIAGVAAGFAAWKIAQTVMGVVKAVKAFTTATEGASLAMKIFNAVGKANVFILIASLVLTVITAIVTFIATNDEARAKFLEIWNKIKEVCGNVIGAICNFFTVTIPQAWNSFLAWLPGFIDGIVQWFSELPGKIWTWLQGVIDSLTTWGTEMYNKAAEWCGGFVDSAVSYISALPGRIWTWLLGVIDSVTTWGTNMYNKAAEVCSGFVSSAVSYISALPGRIWTWLVSVVLRVAAWGVNMWNNAKTIATNFVNSVVTCVSQLPGKIWTWLQNVISRIISWGSSMWNYAKTIATNFVNHVVNYVRQLPGKIWTWLSNVISRVVSWGTTLWSRAKTIATTFVNNVVNYIRQLPTKIQTWLSNVIDKIVSWGTTMWQKGKQAAQDLLDAVVDKIKEIPDDVVSIGSDIVSGLWNGINNKLSWVKGKISGFCSSALDGIKNFFGIKSPSTVMRDQVGRYIAEGLSVGITENADKPLDALKSLSDDMAAQEFAFNDANINRKLSTTFKADFDAQSRHETALLAKLDSIYNRLDRLQIILDTGTLVGETIDKIDMGLANKQILSARGV